MFFANYENGVLMRYKSVLLVFAIVIGKSINGDIFIIYASRGKLSVICMENFVSKPLFQC